MFKWAEALHGTHTHAYSAHLSLCVAQCLMLASTDILSNEDSGLLFRMACLYTIQSLKLGHLIFHDIPIVWSLKCVCLQLTNTATQNALFIHYSIPKVGISH